MRFLNNGLKGREALLIEPSKAQDFAAIAEKFGFSDMIAKLLGARPEAYVTENGIADGIDFFHMDALSSTVAMKVGCDLQLTLLASSLYRLLGTAVGNGYQQAKSRHIFRDLVDATAQVTLTDHEIEVRFQKRAHNPLLLAAGFDKTDLPIPWLGEKHLRLVFG